MTERYILWISGVGKLLPEGISQEGIQAAIDSTYAQVENLKNLNENFDPSSITIEVTKLNMETIPFNGDE